MACVLLYLLASCNGKAVERRRNNLHDRALNLCLMLQRLREELKEIALDRCAKEVKAFAACASAAGLKVIFSCRDENQAGESCDLRLERLCALLENFQALRWQRVQHACRSFVRL